MAENTLVIDGLDDFIRNTHYASVAVKTELDKAMVQSVNAIKNDAQTLAPFITGTLRRSLFTQIQDNGATGIVGQDSTQAPYGRAIEFGTIGMTINVPNGRQTKFGRTRPYSFIGNIKPHWYMSNAFDQNIETVKGFFQQAVKNIIQTAGGKL